MYGVFSDKTVKEFFDSYISTSTDVDENDKQFVELQIHRHSHSCKKGGINKYRFGFPLPPMTETSILELFSKETSEVNLKKHKDNYRNVVKVMNSLAKGEEMEFLQFLERCHLNYDQYLSAVRSTLKKKQIFYKRTVKDMSKSSQLAAITDLESKL